MLALHLLANLLFEDTKVDRKNAYQGEGEGP